MHLSMYHKWYYIRLIPIALCNASRDFRKEITESLQVTCARQCSTHICEYLQLRETYVFVLPLVVSC